jgi:hypothetical protein
MKKSTTDYYEQLDANKQVNLEEMVIFLETCNLTRMSQE